MLNNGGLSASDVALLSGNNNGFGDGNGWWVWILLFALFGGWGNGGYGNGGSVRDAYVLNSDFATIQRQLSDGFNGVDSKLDAQNSGICNLGYTQLELANQNNVTTMQGFNELQSALASCCCTQRAEIKDTQYAIATTGAGIQNAIKDCCCENDAHFADLKYTMATENCATRQAIADSTRQIIDYMSNEKLQTLRDENFTLKLASSQACQNQYLVNALRPTPIPSFNVPAPWGYGYGFNGTTIA